MRCAGCNGEIEVGDRYIEAAASRFLGPDVDPGLDDLMGELLTGRAGTIVYCEGCTEKAEEGFTLQTFYGDES